MARGKRSKEGQYIPLTYAIAKSAAWRSLSGNAAKVWTELHTRYNGFNNGRLILSFEEAATTLGIGKSTVGRAFNELQEKGFIVLKVKGQWYGRKAHEWRLTTKPDDTDKKAITPTNDWKTWQPVERDKSKAS